MTGTDERDPQKLPMTFYGKSYLGRDVSVPLTGESPTGVPAGGVAAIPAGGAGPTAPQTPEAGTPATPDVGPSGVMENLNYALQGLQGVDVASDVYKAVTGAGAGAAGAAGAMPWYAADPFLSSLGAYGGPVGYGTVLAPAGSGAAFAPAAAGSGVEAAAGTAGTAAATGAGLVEGLAAGLLPAAALYALQQVPQKERSWIETAQMAYSPMTALLFPDFWMSVFSGQNPLNPKPPAMEFPRDNWNQMATQITGSLPPPLPVSPGASPEQKAAIEAANQKIDNIRGQFTTFPHYLMGKQSAETWRNSMNTMQQSVQQQFGELADMYGTAYQSFLASQPQVPQGAPAGLIEAVGTPLAQLQEAMASGDLEGARAALASYGNPAEAMARYAPQLEAGRELPGTFYRDDEKKKELT